MKNNIWFGTFVEAGLHLQHVHGEIPERINKSAELLFENNHMKKPEKFSFTKYFKHLVKELVV